MNELEGLRECFKNKHDLVEEAGVYTCKRCAKQYKRTVVWTPETGRVLWYD